MRLRLSLALVALLIAVVILKGWISSHSGIRQPGVFATEVPAPYFHYLPVGTPRGRILTIHGLGANKEIMNLLCLGLSDAGFEVYSMDLPGHGDSPVGFNAMLARRAVVGALNVLGPGTMVIGHSFGGGLLLDIANDRSFGSMVLLSPAPVSLTRIQANRMLVLTGQLDLPRIQLFVAELKDDLQGEFRTREIPWSGHSGYLLQPEAIREIAAWLGGDAAQIHTDSRLLLFCLELLCAVLAAALALRGKAIAGEPIRVASRIVCYIAACAAAFWISGFVVVLTVLRLFAAGYLISFIFLTGLLLMSTRWRSLALKVSPLWVSLFATACVIAFARLVGSELVHLTLTAGGWWRFILISAAVLPLSLADELLLRPIRPWWKAAGAAALTRILIGAFVITAVLTLNRGSAFLVLVVHFVVLLWIGLWLAGELLRRQTQDALATGIFVALTQGWIFAAIFVRL